MKHGFRPCRKGFGGIPCKPRCAGRSRQRGVARLGGQPEPAGAFPAAPRSLKVGHERPEALPSGVCFEPLWQTSAFSTGEERAARAASRPSSSNSMGAASPACAARIRACAPAPGLRYVEPQPRGLHQRALHGARLLDCRRLGPDQGAAECGSVFRPCACCPCAPVTSRLFGPGFRRAAAAEISERLVALSSSSRFRARSSRSRGLRQTSSRSPGKSGRWRPDRESAGSRAAGLPSPSFRIPDIHLAGSGPM